MPDRDDQLISEFNAQRSESAFAALVRQHLDLVFGTAMRQVGDRGAAEEITQSVFIALAQSAGKLGSHPTIAGWLHRTTLNKSREWLRAEFRRQHREQKAVALADARAEGDSVWAPLVPLLDEALLHLQDHDRTAVILHFIEGRTFQEVGAALGVTEDTARKRVDRCLDQLTGFFHRHGFTVPALSTAPPLFALARHTAPTGMAGSVTATALANHSATTLTGALKIMAWSKAKIAVAAGIGVLIVTGTVMIAGAGGGDGSVDRRVVEIVETHTNDASGGADLLAAIGPKTLPALERLIRWKKSRWDFYGVAEHEKLRASAMGIAAELGPAAVRPLTSVLCDAVTDPDFVEYARTADANAIGLVQSELLAWSVPESPKATASLTAVFTNTAQWTFPGGYSPQWETICTNLPDAVSLVTPWLKNPAAVWQATHALGFMGTNAAAAIPALIQVANDGVDNPVTKIPAIRYITRGNKKSVPQKVMTQLAISKEDRARNRSEALNALGKIGIASPEVVDAVQRTLADKDDRVRFGALKAIYALDLRPEQPLADVLAGLPARREWSFEDVVQWAGSLGPEGHDAVPWLQRLSDLRYVQTIPDGVHTNLGNHIAIPAENLCASAMLSICQIDPSQVDPSKISADQLVWAFFSNWEATQQLRTNAAAAPVLALLKPELESTNTMEAALTAYVLLGQDPHDPGALSTLRRCATGEDRDHLMAAEFLWDVTGDSNDLLGMAVKALKAPGNSGHLAPQWLAKMGDAARPAVPALKEALWAPDDFEREMAGIALQKIAPEELPPVR